MTTQDHAATEAQVKQIRRFLEDGVTNITVDDIVALGFSKIEAQEIIKNGNLLHKDMKKSAIELLRKYAIIDKRFGPATVIEFTVPKDYNHNTQLTTFGEKTKKLKTTYFYNDALTDENFKNATNKLEPGKTYQVKFFPILERVTSEDCMNFLRKQNAVLVGGQGITLLQQNIPESFPVGKWTISFDEKDALWKDADGNHRVPRVRRGSDGAWGFGLGHFENDWSSAYVLVCFCDISA